jgi:hypothetical protein
MNRHPIIHRRIGCDDDLFGVDPWAVLYLERRILATFDALDVASGVDLATISEDRLGEAIEVLYGVKLSLLRE